MLLLLILPVFIAVIHFVCGMCTGMHTLPHAMHVKVRGQHGPQGLTSVGLGSKPLTLRSYISSLPFKKNDIWYVYELLHLLVCVHVFESVSVP